MLGNTLLLIIGFIILIKGADILVDGSSGLAENFKVSKMLIGLTIVAFGTSMPEFAVCIKSILAGSGDIALGNTIGSNTLNILLILGCCATFHSLNVKSNTVRKELPIATAITVLFAILLSDNLLDSKKINMLTRADGIILLLFFMVFIYYLATMIRNKSEEEISNSKMPIIKCLLFIVLGLIGVIWGSNLVVDSAIFIAKALNISERMISLTIVALGTSLPELVTGITSTRKGEYDLVIGNVVGSNILNIGGVVGISTAILGGTGAVSFSYFDLLAMILSSILLFMASFNDYKISRREGMLFLILFVIYYIYVIAS